MSEPQKAISFDNMGIWASSICIVHCLAAPALLILGLDSILWVVDHPWLEIAIISVTVTIGLIAFFIGYRVHRQHFIPVLFVAGALLMINGESVAEEWLGLLLSSFGALIVIYAHFHNYQLRRHVA